MRKVQTEPKICVFIQPREDYIGWIDMILINVGTGPSYNDASRKRYGESFNISFSQFKGLSQLYTSSLSKITRDIEIIKKDFSSLVNGNAFIKIFLSEVRYNI